MVFWALMPFSLVHMYQHLKIPYPGVHIFPKNLSSHLKILGATTQDLVATAPLRLGFVHP